MSKGIGLATPRGINWEYSLDGQNWQASNIFPNMPDGTPFVKGVAYTILCRNIAQEAVAATTVVFGRATNEDGLDEIVKRSGITTALVKLLGGLFLANIPSTTEDFPTLVVGPNGQVYTKGGSISLEPVTTVVMGSIYEEKPDYVVIVAPNPEWQGTTDNPLPTVNAVEPDHLITTSGVQYYALRGDLFSDPGDTLTLVAAKFLNPATTSLPFGVSLSQVSGEWRIYIAADVPDQNFLIRTVAIDSAEQTSLPSYHRLTINRAMTVIMPEVPSLTHSNDLTFPFFGTDGDSPGYVVISGNWSWNSADQLVQTNTTSTGSTMILCTSNGSQNELDAVQSLAKVKIKSLASSAWIGVGIRYSLSGAGGYSLLIIDSTSVQLLHDGVAFGPFVTIPALVVGASYFQKIRYEETGTDKATISAKIWNVLQAEPATWSLTWANQARVSGYPAIHGGSNGATAAFGYWDDSKNF
ncbi:hypothetical protein [Spirosoma litoris]